jgi:predicted transcriptional regulator/uncharacterized Zn-finger protein
MNRSKILGIVFFIIAGGFAVWLTATMGARSGGATAMGFIILVILPALIGAYMFINGGKEEKEMKKVEIEQKILNAVETRGTVKVNQLIVETGLTKDTFRDYLEDLVGKGLFTGYVDWKGGKLVSADMAKLDMHKCPNCGAPLELAGKGVVRCPYCGTEIFLK